MVDRIEEWIAFYLRLSVADGDKSESNSIANQRALLYKYIEDHPELQGKKIVEFIDDGESGTNFGRSEFQRLLDEVRKGKIKTILVKDFSRFGRGYIDVSDYIEQIFPFMGVRFISVNDRFDSAQHKYGSAGMIDVGFKQIMHQYYSVSLSQKILNAHSQLAEKGKFHSSYAIFGYKKSAEKYRLIIDEPAAETVRYIFKEAINGKTAVEIAAELNRRGVPTPLQVLKQNNPNVKRKWNDKDRYVWNGAMVLKILREEQYTGKFIFGKTRVEKVGGKQIKVPREEWTIIPDVFPVIIPQEVFDQAQKPKRVQPQRTDKPGAYFFGVRCGHCGMAMSYQRNVDSESHYSCREYINGVYTECKHNRAYEKDIAVLALRTIRDEAKKVLRQMKKAEQITAKSTNADQLRVLQMKLNAIPSKKEKLFARLICGEISKEENARLYAALEKAEITLKEQIEALQTTSAIIDHAKDTQTALQAILDTETLTRDMIQRFVRDIRVYKNERIEITVTLAPLTEQEQLVTKSYEIPVISEARVWLYYRTWYRKANLQAQRESLIEYAADRKWNIVGESGDWHSDAKKKLNKQIIEAAKNGEFDVLLVEDISRISADPKELAEIVSEMKRNKVQIIAVLGTPYYTFMNMKPYKKILNA